MDQDLQMFWLTMSGIIVAFFTVVLKMCLKSKCYDINCCELLKIKRDVILEEKENEFNIEHGIYDNDNRQSSNNFQSSKTRLDQIIPV